jgi:Ca-activated chloride channel family protein
MSFLAPLALALGLLAVPIVVLYMLKLRRREVEVSSTMLWQLLLRDREANAPWQRLRRNLLMLLQLLLLAALVLALARPFWPVATVANGTLVVLLDGSASMQATDVAHAPTRFDAARAEVGKLIDGLGTGGSMSIILVGRQPEVLAAATADKQVLRDALNRAHPSDASGDWAAVMALAAGAVRAGNAAQSVIVVVSDGRLPPNLPTLPAEVRYIPIGSSTDNLAVRALALRPAAGGPQLFASVANYGTANRPVVVSISRNGQLYSVQQLAVPAGGSADLVLTNLPPEPAIYEARLLPPADTAKPASGARLDQLPLDDQAWAVYQPPAAGRVLLISPGNVFLEQVFAALSAPLGLKPFRLQSGQPLPSDPFDLYVFDGAITGTLPATDLLLVNPPSNALFSVGATFTNTAVVGVTQNDPLTQFVDWSNVHLLKARQVVPPAWARVLVQAEGGPLVFVGEVGGRRVAVLTFDLHNSDLPLQVTFPVLIANLLNYLAPAQPFSAGDGLQPGQSLLIKPGSSDTAITVQDPTGAVYLATTTQGGVVFANTNVLGVYTVLSNQAVLGHFAVNLFDPGESNIRPATSIRIGRTDIQATAPEAQGQLEIWPWLAGAAFVLLLLEWWIYHRGATLPALSGWRGIFARRRMKVER